jgi:hypothetical protein
MGWLATTGGVSGEMVRDLMSESLEYRFGPAALTAPHATGELHSVAAIDSRLSTLSA